MNSSSPKKILYTSIFKPCGVDDRFGRKEMPADCLKSQIMPFQDIFVPMITYQTYGLHLIANNLKDYLQVVLDFPSLEYFQAEITKHSYDYIGISFILQNFLKMKLMVELIKKFSPRSKIILGGPGTLIPGLQDITNADYICQGEGIRFMRQLLGQQDQKFAHPKIYRFNPTLFGHKNKKQYPVITNGVGCNNSCEFCASSTLFGNKKIQFINQENLVNYILQIYAKQKSTKYTFIGDENLLQDNPRLCDLFIEGQKQVDQYLEFSIFSSIDLISQYSVDTLCRAGIQKVWLGLESKYSQYGKNKVENVHQIVKNMLDAGISVTVSIILFHDRHTKKNIWEDIRWAYDFKAPFYQFMIYTPTYGTALYNKMKQENRLLEGIPLEEWHGLKQLCHVHPHFTPWESEQIRNKIYQDEYFRFGPGIIRDLAVKVKGFHYSLNRESQDPVYKKRTQYFFDSIKSNFSICMACHKLALEKHHRELIGKILEDCGKIVGKPSAKDYLMAAYLIGRGKLQRLLSSREGDAWTWQPDTSRCEYLNGKCISCEVV